MNVNILNPFVEGAVEVVRKEVGVVLTRGSLSLQKSQLVGEDVNIILSLIGDVRGTVLYSLSYGTGLALLSKMVGQEFKEFNKLAQSGVAELANVITGRATVNLSRVGYTTDISPPTLILGQGTQISTLDLDRILVPLHFDGGTLSIHLALREG